MLSELRPAIVMTVLFTLLTGVAYPLAMTGVAQLAFSDRADGSLVRRDGKVVGSSLIGQAFAASSYFHGRPSAAGKGYDAASSGGSNLGPTSKALLERITADTGRLHTENGGGRIPADLVTASGSGLDPDISPAGAAFQVERVAKARGLAPADVQRLVDLNTSGPTLGILGEPRVNVLALNLALDHAFPQTGQAAPTGK